MRCCLTEFVMYRSHGELKKGVLPSSPRMALILTATVEVGKLPSLERVEQRIRQEQRHGKCSTRLIEGHGSCSDDDGDKLR